MRELEERMHVKYLAISGVPIVAQWKQTWLVSMRTQVGFLASLRGLRIGPDQARPGMEPVSSWMLVGLVNC